MPSRKLNLVVLTSLRDVALCDKNGEHVETEHGPRYMMGALEHLVRETVPGGKLAGKFQVVGVVTDDMGRKLGDYPRVPTEGRPWIHPLDLRGPDGVRIADLTVNIPSSFRSMPGDDEAGRAAAKLSFETRVHEFMEARGADVVLSDHYMARIDHLYRWRPGRVINIHPGITKPGHPFSFLGKTPTVDAIRRAKEVEGVCTGATLHYVDAIIDHGDPIHSSEDTPVRADDEPQHLRHRNYKKGKLPVLIEGLAKFHQQHAAY